MKRMLIVFSFVMSCIHGRVVFGQACRPFKVSANCKVGDPHGFPPWNDAFLEGEGLETLHFAVKSNAGSQFPPAPDSVLKSTAPCGKAPQVSVKILHCTKEARGMADCAVDVVDGNGICKSLPGESATKDRGVKIVRGSWDGTGKWSDDGKTVTLSCAAGGGGPQAPHADGALTTCIQSGYFPDTDSEQLEACIRAVRADYCGDGIPHTLRGTLMRLHDKSGHAMTVAECGDEGLSFEASWSSRGAVCVDHERWVGVGMGRSDCKDRFSITTSDGLHCQADETEAVVFTRSRCNVCPSGAKSDQACTTPDKDPICTGQAPAHRRK